MVLVLPLRPQKKFRFPIRPNDKTIQMTDKHDENYVSSSMTDWAIFAVSLVITIAMLIFLPAWWWLGLPFVLTYAVKGYGAL